MANEIVGALKYLFAVDEATWGVFNPAPVYVPIPVTDYSCHFVPQTIEPQPYLGSFQRKSSINVRGMVTGQLSSPLYGSFPTAPAESLAQYLIDWAFADYELATIRSKSIQWAEGPNVSNKQHTGLRVASATIAGDDQSGMITISLQLMGQAETNPGAAQALPTNWAKIPFFEFKDATFTIASTPVLLKSFQIQIQNAVKVEYLNSFTPTLILKTDRQVSVQMTPVKNSDTYDTYRRAATLNSMDVGCVLKGLCNGTNGVNTWSIVTVDVPQAVFQTADEQGAVNDICTQPLHFMATKPDSASNDIAFTYSAS